MYCIIVGVNCTLHTESDIFCALNKFIETFNLLQSNLLFWIATVLSKLSFQKLFLV